MANISRNDVPDWTTHGGGGKRRVALWLAAEVGEGGAFTKASVRQAFPGVEQIDRRMRDLRTEGWVIATYREDRSLAPDELRLVAIGGHVWVKGYVSKARVALNERERNTILSRDMWTCRFCGVGAGNIYPDEKLRKATLLVTTVGKLANSEIRVCSCERCLKSNADLPSRESIEDRFRDLSPGSKSALSALLNLSVSESGDVRRAWAISGFTDDNLLQDLLNALLP